MRILIIFNPFYNFHIAGLTNSILILVKNTFQIMSIKMNFDNKKCCLRLCRSQVYQYAFRSLKMFPRVSNAVSFGAEVYHSKDVFQEIFMQ